MNTNNTEIFVGIVVRTEKVRESDLRVRLLCPDGLKQFNASGVLKPNAKLNVATQLFTIAEFSVAGHKIIGASILQPNHNITRDIKKYYLACAICEVVGLCHGAGFMLTARALESLDKDDCDIRKTYTDYFTTLLVELGYDIEKNMDINTAFLHYLDIKIPNTKYFLV